MRGTRGVVKRAMRSEARAAVFLGVVALEQERLGGLHVWKIEPSMRWIGDEAQGLANPIRIDEIARDEITGGNAPRRRSSRFPIGMAWCRPRGKRHRRKMRGGTVQSFNVKGSFGPKGFSLNGSGANWLSWRSTVRCVPLLPA